MIEAVLLLVPVSVAIYYQESSQVFIALFSTIGILVLLGGLGVLRKPKNQRIYAKGRVLIVALLVGFYGLSLVASPLSFQGQILSIIDAFFEISSGFTTTGATILNDVSRSHRSLPLLAKFHPLDRRDGVLVFALAIMDNAMNSHLEVMGLRSLDRSVFRKVVSKLKTLPKFSIC